MDLKLQLTYGKQAQEKTDMLGLARICFLLPPILTNSVCAYLEFPQGIVDAERSHSPALQRQLIHIPPKPQKDTNLEAWVQSALQGACDFCARQQ